MYKVRQVFSVDLPWWERVHHRPTEAGVRWSAWQPWADLQTGPWYVLHWVLNS